MRAGPPSAYLSRPHIGSLVEEMLRSFGEGIEPPPNQPRPDALSLLAWTERYRTIGGTPLTPSRIPWLRDLYDLSWLGERGREAVVMKASQVMISEWMVNTALWVCDTGRGGRGNALYVFPTQREANDFSQARVDSAINESSYLANRTGVSYGFAHGHVTSGRKSPARVMLKRVGRGFLYMRGGDKRRQLLTVDGDALLLDEVEEYHRGTIDVARQRLNSALDPLVRIASTPKYPSGGIAPVFGETTRRRYHYRCGGCGLAQHLQFPENLTREGRLVCCRCGDPLDRLAEGEWVAEYPDAEVEGFHVNRLMSPRTNLVELAQAGYDIEDHLQTDPSAIQEFRNQSLGLPHAPAGGALTDDILNGCCRDYEVPAALTMPPVAMGVDVGGVCHWWVKAPAPDQERNPGATRLIAYGTAPNEDGPDGEPWPILGQLMERYRVRCCVIDALPEDDRSARFCDWWGGRAFRCFYHDESQWRYASASAWNVAERVVHAQRTRAMDQAINRFHRAEEELPRDARYHPYLYRHLKAPVRVLAEDARGHTVARYQEGLEPDHLCHAATYCELARVFATTPGTPAARTNGHRKPVRVGGR